MKVHELIERIQGVPDAEIYITVEGDEWNDIASVLIYGDRVEILGAPDDDDEIYDYGELPEPIGIEAFENSYIGGGGAPDYDNM